MIDLVSEMANAHARFRTGALGVRVPGRPRVWRAAYLAPADVDRGMYWTLERAPLPVPSGRPIEPELGGHGIIPFRKNSAEMSALCVLEWMGLLGPCRQQKAMGYEIGVGSASTICQMIRKALEVLGQDRSRRGYWDRVFVLEEEARRRRWDEADRRYAERMAPA